MKSSKLVFFLIGFSWTLVVWAQGGKALKGEIHQDLWQDGVKRVSVHAQVEHRWQWGNPPTVSTIAKNLQFQVQGATVAPIVFFTNQRWFHYQHDTTMIGEERQQLTCQLVSEGKSRCEFLGTDPLLLGQKTLAQTGVVQYFFLQEIEIFFPPVSGDKKQRGNFLRFNLAQIAIEAESGR